MPETEELELTSFELQLLDIALNFASMGLGNFESYLILGREDDCFLSFMEDDSNGVDKLSKKLLRKAQFLIEAQK